MGRYSTGAWTVYECLRIDMSFLLKMGYIKRNSILFFSLSWADQRGNPSGSITCESSYLGTPEKNYLELIYTLTKRTGEVINRRYKVYFSEKGSNLGKGKVLYFICPIRGTRCRILYSAYGSDYFKSREAYSNRLYYDCQIASKLGRYNDNYWRIENHLSKIEKAACRGNRTYKGELTKRAFRYNKLFEKQQWMDEARWTLGVPKCLKKDIKFLI